MREPSLLEGSVSVLSPSLLAGCECLVRRVKDLRLVLYDWDSCRGLDPEMPVYEVYRDACGSSERRLLLDYGLRYDVTVMPPRLLGEEYVKTVGHRHAACNGGPYPEVFEVLEGEAHFLLEKQGGPEVLEVSLLVAEEGEKVLIPPSYGHVMINASSSRLVTGNLISRSCVQVYDQYVERRGGVFYVLTGGRLVRNPRYFSMPEIQVWNWKTPPFLGGGTGLVDAFLRDPDRFMFLNERGRYERWEVTR